VPLVLHRSGERFSPRAPSDSRRARARHMTTRPGFPDSGYGRPTHIPFVSVGQGPENVRRENESHLDPPEQGRAREPKAAGKHRRAHRDAVQRGRETFRARDQLRRQERLQGARARETRVQLRGPTARCSDGQVD